MGMIKIPQAAQRKFDANYRGIFESGNLAEGRWNQALADYVRAYTSSAAAVPFCSNGAGVLAILVLLKRFRGYKRVFIQSNTMYGVKTMAVTSGLEYVGAVPCSASTLMPTAEAVSKFLESTPEPEQCVFLTSHIGGIVNPDIREIARICAERGVALVEDCAHSFGATIDGKHTGLFGVAGVYSLYATKAIAAGEGGLAVTNDVELGELLSRFNIYDRFDRKMNVGVNFRVSELQALFALCMCECSEEIISNKAQIAARYIEACKEVGVRFVDPYQGGQRGNHYKFTLLAERDANEEFAAITQRTSPVYDYALGEDPMRITSRHICLPIWYGLEDQVVESTVAQIKSLRGR